MSEEAEKIPVEEPVTLKGRAVGLGPIRPFGKTFRCPLVVEVEPEKRVYVDFLGRVEKLQQKLSAVKVGQMVEIEAFQRTWIDSEGQERIGYRGRTVKVVQEAPKEKPEERPEERAKEEKPEVESLAEIVVEKVMVDQQLLAKAVNTISEAVLRIREGIEILKKAVEGEKK